ncbi:MAG: phosphomannomutase/phosphoglucomutase [bacterium]
MAGVFKAYDIRGIYPNELTLDLCREIGRAIASFIGGGRIAVGYDMRPSNVDIFRALSDGITDMGADVVSIGLVETPMINFATANYRYDGGVMITASHNPAEYNGFKICREKAMPVSYDTGIDKVESMVLNKSYKAVSSGKGKIVERDIWDDYVAHVRKFARNLKPIKIVIDAGNGMAGLTVPKVFDGLPPRVIPLYFELDGTFPNHEANPLKMENIADLQRKVREEGADLGLAFDGDGDRVAFVDERGEYVPCDLITALIAEEILSESPGEKVLYDLRSSWVVREVIEEQGGIPLMGRVGHSFIKQKLREEDAIFAGELSGHYYFRENFYTDSGIIAALKVLGLLSRRKKPFSELVAPLRKYFPSGEINSRVADPQAKIKELVERYKNGNVYFLDGVSVEFDDWWFNVRPSNTEPVLRLNLEAKSKEKMEHMRDEILRFIRG